MHTNAMPPDARPALVLLHSSMSSRAQWSDLSTLLEPHFRCIAVDLLGYGKAPFPAEDDGATFSLAHEVDAVNAAIAARLVPGEPFHLIGHSYGGATALRLARQLRARVLSLTVFEPVAFHLLAPGDAARMEIASVVSTIKQAATPRDATRVFIDYWNRTGAFDGLPAVQQDKFVSQIAKVKLDFQALLGEPATLADLAVLDMPTLVMSGSNSPASTRALAAALTAALPNATAVQTKGGHMAPISHGALVNPLIAAFLMGAEVVDA